MKAILVTAFIVVGLLTLIAVIYYSFRIVTIRKLETTYLGLIRGVRECNTHDEWKQWREMSSSFLRHAQKYLPPKEYLDYEICLQKILEDKLANLYQMK